MIHLKQNEPIIINEWIHYYFAAGKPIHYACTWLYSVHSRLAMHLAGSISGIHVHVELWFSLGTHDGGAFFVVVGYPSKFHRRRRFPMMFSWTEVPPGSKIFPLASYTIFWFSTRYWVVVAKGGREQDSRKCIQDTSSSPAAVPSWGGFFPLFLKPFMASDEAIPR